MCLDVNFAHRCGEKRVVEDEKSERRKKKTAESSRIYMGNEVGEPGNWLIRVKCFIYARVERFSITFGNSQHVSFPTTAAFVHNRAESRFICTCVECFSVTFGNSQHVSSPTIADSPFICPRVEPFPITPQQPPLPLFQTRHHFLTCPHILSSTEQGVVITAKFPYSYLHSPRHRHSHPLPSPRHVIIVTWNIISEPGRTRARHEASE